MVDLTSVGRCEGAQNGFEPQTDTVSGSLKTGAVPLLEEYALFSVDFTSRSPVCVSNPGIFFTFSYHPGAARSQLERDS